MDTIQAAKILKIPATWLAGVFKVESNNNHLAKNPQSTAVGLIQFIESTAKRLGTSTNELLQMSRSQQMQYVVKYYQNSFKAYGRPKNAGELYLHTFYPAALKMSLNTPLPSHVYKVNKGVDINKDGQLTKADIINWFYNKSGLTNEVERIDTKTSSIYYFPLMAFFLFLIFKN